MPIFVTEPSLRLMYGATAADAATTPSGRLIPGAELTVWTEMVGGTQVTDLLDHTETASMMAVADEYGLVRFWGPPDEDATLWLESGIGPRVLVRPTMLTAQVANNSITNVDIKTDANIGRAKVAGTALTSDSMGVFNVLDFGADPTGAVDSTAEIQAALDAATAVGGVTLVPPGTFLFTELNVGAGTTFQGAGGTLKLNDDTCTNGATAYYLIHNLAGGGAGHPNVVIDGLIVDGNSANNTASLVADLISVVGENVTVRNCTLRDSPDSGIMFSACTNSAVLNNRIEDGRDLGIYINDGTGERHHENVVSGNRITGFPHGGIALKRICQRTIVTHNTIYDCGNGITFERASTDTDFSLNSVVSNNLIRRIGSVGSTGLGIALRQSDHTICSGNRIEDVIGRGIQVQGTIGASVTGNSITLSADNAEANLAIGIEISGGIGYPCTENTVSGNSVFSASSVGSAIRLSSAYISESITGNVIANNIAHGDVALRVDAVADGNIVEGNILNGGTYDVVWYAGADNSVFANNLVVNGTSSGTISSVVKAAMATFGIGNVVSHGTAAPTTLTWKVGDIVWNSAPATGHPAGWMCSVAGTPGTWIAMGNLA